MVEMFLMYPLDSRIIVIIIYFKLKGGMAMYSGLK